MPPYKTKEYSSWSNMKKRCYTPGSRYYHRYGGRGIKVCDRWLGTNGFANFLKDMGKRPADKSLDRINNDGNYEPSNCRWASCIEQNNNREIRADNKSGYRGVYYHKQKGKWAASCDKYNTRKHIGYYITLEEAVAARKEYMVNKK